MNKIASAITLAIATQAIKLNEEDAGFTGFSDPVHGWAEHNDYYEAGQIIDFGEKLGGVATALLEASSGHVTNT